MGWIFLVLPWLLVHLLHRTSPKFRDWLKQCNGSLCWFAISGRTSRGTHCVWSWGGGRWHDCLDLWFSPGPVCALVGAIASLLLLIVNLIHAVSASGLFARLLDTPRDDGSETQPDELMMVVVPGVTLPWHQLGYFWIAILVSVLFHELGHALAASVDRVRTVHMGFSWCLFFPVAYVSLDHHSASFQMLSAKRKLRIAAAGIWHNLALCAFCLVLSRLLPVILSGLYNYGVGIRIVNIDAVQAPGLWALIPAGTRVIAVDNIPIISSQEWLQALHSAGTVNVSELEPSIVASVGRCAPWLLVQEEQARAGTSCCLAAAATSADGATAIELTQDEPSPSCWNVSRLFDNQHQPYSRVCTRGKDVFSRGSLPCKAAPDCSPDQVCVSPAISDLFPSDRLILLSVQRPLAYDTNHNAIHAMPGNSTMRQVETGTSGTDLFVFLGHPSQLAASIVTSDYLFRETFFSSPGSFLSHISHLLERHGVSVPDVLARALAYVTAVSASLALLNAAPIYYADGAISVGLLLEHFGLAPKGSGHEFPRQARPILLCGTSLLFVTLAISSTNMVGTVLR
eukprot:gb/GEZN01004491.1/.p1 GENE.gb/GEZN01004491.1/~~gb/GEZN01004491.1/.p1  ORF type:complete len:569 (+),score=42.36 gb/GEZN01004491.1/:222-1928(+)